MQGHPITGGKGAKIHLHPKLRRVFWGRGRSGRLRALCSDMGGNAGPQNPAAQRGTPHTPRSRVPGQDEVPAAAGPRLQQRGRCCHLPAPRGRTGTGPAGGGPCLQPDRGQPCSPAPLYSCTPLLLHPCIHLFLRPFIPAPLHPQIPPPLHPFTPSLYPFNPLLLHPFTPTSLCPFIPAPLHPFTPIPLHPSTPTSLHPFTPPPQIPSPQIPASLYSSIPPLPHLSTPVFLHPFTPTALCPFTRASLHPCTPSPPHPFTPAPPGVADSPALPPAPRRAIRSPAPAATRLCRALDPRKAGCQQQLTHRIPRVLVPCCPLGEH